MNLERDACQLARALASQRKTTVGAVLSEALLQLYRPAATRSTGVVIDESGFPAIDLGRVITPEEVTTSVEEH